MASARAQQAFSDMGIFISTGKAENNTIKIVAQSRNGKRFTLTLKGRKTDHGDETQLSIHWEKDADDAFWLELAGAITNPKPAATSPYLPQSRPQE